MTGKIRSRRFKVLHAVALGAAVICATGASVFGGDARAATQSSAAGPVLFSRDKPIEITADALDVDQEKKTATFDGNVDALQGDIRMKAKRITVFYDGTGQASADPVSADPVAAGEEEGAGAMPGAGKIRKMVVSGPVHVSSPKETATGDNAVYDVEAARVTLTGNVILTRGGNIIRGSTLTINTETGRSIIDGGSSAGGSSGGRVSGVFMPSQAQDQGPGVSGQGATSSQSND